MKVLVTGATGFLGKCTALRLVKGGAQVTGLGRNVALGAELEKQGVHFAQADLSSAQNLAQIFADHDFVIHCAALSTPWGRYADFFEANVRGTMNVIAAVKSAKIRRLVHVSTPSLYVDRSSRMNISEADPLPKMAINHYAQTKREAEACIDQAFAEGLPVITIRPQGIIGPGDSAILPRLIRVAKRGVLPVIGEGNNWVDLTYVDNVAHALILALRAPDSALGQKFNISNGEPVMLYDTLEKIFHALGFSYRKKHLSFRKAYAVANAMELGCKYLFTSKEPLLTRYSVCVLALSRTLDIDSARRQLNYQPIVPMSEAIEKVISGYLQERPA